jgi:hypothetical protein
MFLYFCLFSWPITEVLFRESWRFVWNRIKQWEGNKVNCVISPVNTVTDSMKWSCHSLRGQLQQRSEFALRVVNVRFVAEEVALRQVSPYHFVFPQSALISSMLQIKSFNNLGMHNVHIRCRCFTSYQASRHLRTKSKAKGFLKTSVRRTSEIWV